jgi:tripartite ATP-independent transporter DctP family solute receptor
MKTLARTLLAGSAALLLAAMPATAEIRLKLSNIQPESHPASFAMMYFAEQLKNLTNGEIIVEVFHNRQLGDAVANVQSMRNATIAFTTVSASNLNQVLPQMDVLSLPFLFRNEDHFWWYLGTKEAADFVKPLEEKGIKKIAWIDSGARNFFTRDKAVRTPADLKGLKIRTMASPVQVKMMEAFGGTGVPVAWGELYNALQTGVVDGAENNHPSIASMKFFEVSKFYTLNEHARIPDLLCASTRLLERLSDSQRKAVDQAGLLTEAYMRGAWKISELESLAQLKSRFIEIIPVQNKQPFIDSVSSLVQEEAKRLNAVATVDFILQTGKKF